MVHQAASLLNVLYDLTLGIASLDMGSTTYRYMYLAASLLNVLYDLTLGIASLDMRSTTYCYLAASLLNVL